MKVRNVTKDGRAVPNQFIIDDGNTHYFQSYDSVVAKWETGMENIELDEIYWDYSRTTARWRNFVLGATTEGIKSAIKHGIITLTNLN